MTAIKEKGIYCILLDVSPGVYSIGALGVIHFDGYYVYVGSAQNNISKRISRHLRKDKKTKWHVDYLTGYSDNDVRDELGASKNRDEDVHPALKNKDKDIHPKLEGRKKKISPASVKRIYIRKDAMRSEECVTAGILAEYFKPVKNFGSSDCKCVSHLFHIDDKEKLDKMLRGMGFEEMRK